MSMGGMSLVLAKPSTTNIINLHKIKISPNSSKTQSLATSRSSSSSLLFHPLSSFHYHLSSSLTQTLSASRRSALTVRSSVQPLPPPTPPPNPSNAGSSPGFFGRKGWLAGIFLSLFLPFLKGKWGPIIFLKKQIDQKLQTVEDIAETLEKVADRVDHMAEEFGKDLPDGSFKKAVGMIEDVAEKVEAAAHLTDEAIDKIQELEDEMESKYKEAKLKEASEINEEKIENKPT